LNKAFQKSYDIRAGTGSQINIGPDIPLNSEGKVDQKEFAKRTLVLVQQYHAQGLHQSKISFWFSIISAGVGFIVIIYGALLALSPTHGQISAEFRDLTPAAGAQGTLTQTMIEPLLVMVSGAIIDAVAALFFVQSNKSRLLMSDFFDRLRVDRKLEEALALIRDIKSEEVAGRTQALLAINLAEIGLDGPLYDRVITGAYKQQDSRRRSKNSGPTELRKQTPEIAAAG
jgi:hypothetical protein